MLIKQNQLLGEAGAFLDNLDRLDYESLDESSYPAHMVNVRHNPRLGKDLIQLESFLQFGQNNGIDDGGYALHLVCEANDAPRDSLAFIVNEENLLADSELFANFVELKENYFDVYVAPISDESPYYTELLEALYLDEAYDGYENCPNLQAYVNESIIGGARTKLVKGADAVKSKVSSGAREIGGKLASVRKEIAKKTKKMTSATGSAKVFLKKQIDKLKGVAQALKSKAIGAKDAVSNAVSNAANSVSNAVGNVKSAIGNKFSSAKDAVSNAVDNVRAKFA